MLRQFDVVLNPSEKSRNSIPYLIVLQSDLTMSEETVVVAPLLPESRIPAPSRLFPRVQVDGNSLVLATSELGAVRRKTLGSVVDRLGSERDQIVAALDLLFLGV